MLGAVTLRTPAATGSIDLYHRYAVGFWGTAQLPREYPLLSVLPFSLTLLPPGGDLYWKFGAWMAGMAVFGQAALQKVGSTSSRAFAVYVLVGGAGTLLARFDLVPALATLAALWCARRRRFAYGYALLAAAVLLKLYPAFLVPLLAIEHAKVAGRLRPPVLGVASTAAGVVAGFGVAWLVDGRHAFTPLWLAVQRPIQVESLPATLLWLLSLAGVQVRAEHSFGSYNLVGGPGAALAAIFVLALGAGCALVYVLHARGRLSVTRAFLVVLALVVITGKVFSPQYLLWLLPFVAVEIGLDAAWLAVCALTALVYPLAYWREGLLEGKAEPVMYSALFLALIAVRNLVLIATLSRTFRSAFGSNDHRRDREI